MIRVIVPLILTAIMVFTIVDLVTIDNSRVRYLPKVVWILLAIFLSLIGCLLWFLLGREPVSARENGRYANDPLSAPPNRSPRAGRPTRRGPSAPDDDSEFLDRLNREQQQEQRIRDLEKRLSELDDGKLDDGKLDDDKTGN
ncbi:MAG TPA: PLD nuclease N-terminal domain-containing protein [Pseudolysinimonas sp.]|nr:PLD nuclease N-terminal domain-containing protein [Pseudolysinimonas sp.]